MPAPLPHHPHRLDRSRLSALLRQWSAPAGRASAPQRDVAEQLGQWLGTVDAVQLSRALQAIEGLRDDEAGVPGPAALDGPALARMVHTARSELLGLPSAQAAPARPPRARADNTPVPGPDPLAEAEFAGHGARYLALQKQGEARVAALRAQVRQRLSAGPARLRQLAALDAVMEQMLGAREQRLWATLAGHLERRFAQRLTAHRQALAAQPPGSDGTAPADDPLRWRHRGGWLHAFDGDLQALWVAEAQARLQPIMGLLEAAAPNENMERQE